MSVPGETTRIREDLALQVRRFIATNRRRRVVRTAFRLAEVVLDGWHNVDYDVERNGEARVAAVITATGPCTVLDVGANRGEWALQVAAANREATVHCFEISTSTRESLRARAGENPNVTVAELGLDRAAGSIPVKRYPSIDSYTSIYDYPHGDPFEWSDEPVTTGDAYLAEHGITRVDLLKLDIEGAEHRVLEGFAEALASRRIRAIQFEYGKVNVLTRFLLRDFYEFLEAHGFLIGKIFPTYVEFRSYELEHEDFRGPNYLAVLKDEAGLLAAL